MGCVLGEMCLCQATTSLKSKAVPWVALPSHWGRWGISIPHAFLVGAAGVYGLILAGLLLLA